MLVRTARPRRSRNEQALCEAASSLLLPFLCPAHIRWTTTYAAKPTAKRPTRSSSPPTSPERRSARSLASVATNDSLTSHDCHFDSHHSFLNWKYPLPNANVKEPIYEPLILKHDREPETKQHSIRNGIGGTGPEMLQSLYTCLRVSRFERAEAVILRLAHQTKDATMSELVHAHETYLDARLADLSSPPGQAANYASMRKWYHKHIHTRKVPVGPDAYATLIRAALRGEKDHRQKTKAIRRFLRDSQLSSEQLLDHPSLDSRDFLLLTCIFENKDVDGSTLEKLEQDHFLQTVHVEQPTDSYTVPRHDMPEVLKIEQKGVGLESLQEGLAAVQQDPEQLQNLADMDPDTLHLRNTQREMLIEASASAAAVARWKAEEEKLNAIGVHSALHSRPIGAMMWTWYSALLPVVKDELAQVKTALDKNAVNARTDERQVYGAHLESLSPEALASNTILFVMNMLGRGKDRETDQYSSNLKLAMVTIGLGKQMQQESNAEATRKSNAAPKVASSKRKLTRKKHHLRSLKATRPTDMSQLEWPLAIKVRIGAMLISKLIETATIPITREHPRTKLKHTQLQPALFHKTVYKLGKKQGFLLASPDLIEKIHREPLGDLICKKLPMVVEPKPWTGFKQGGYLNYSTDFIRFPATDKTPRDYALAAIDRRDVKSVFHALNILSKIPWKIHNDVLRVQIEAWNSGQAIGAFAPLDPSATFPPEPAPSADPNIRKRWLTNIQEIKNKQASLHSLRCHQNLQLETARAFRNETIYLPHNIDFRGRAYPIPPYLNHMGADNSRALVIFANGKPLGRNGLRWLKIHLANVAGNDKASLQEREDYVMQHLDDVYDSAEKPLAGRRWWAKSEDAWQTLAACIELRNALESPDPTKYISNLPIHQDGTCNGLQHYAALGGDEIGARQVNLEPSDRPSDVYTAVAEAVKGHIARDLVHGDPCAKILHGHVGRRVVKQPVMTNVYGVTYYGVRAQVKKQLEEIFPQILKTDTINHGTLAAYIASKISKSMNEMFNGAQAIQEWFGKCADRITSCVTPEQIERIRTDASKKSDKKSGAAPSSLSALKRHFKSSVIWTTPLRLPVVQPYRSPSRSLVQTAIQTVALQEPQTWDPINRRKQLQAFPPNFIHSLDASHMMLSAIKSEDKGIMFASIHDSFWTHACDIDDLSEVLRDAFVDMHGENIVGRLREEFETRYKDCMYLASVQADSRLGNQIKKQQTKMSTQRRALSKAKTSNMLLADLLIETDRLRLLASEDAAEVERGQAMVTPGSLFDADLDEASLVTPHEILSTKLGSSAGNPSGGSVTGTEVEMVSETNQATEMADDVAATADDTSIEVPEDLKTLVAQTDPKAAASRSQKRIYVWLPMSFPPIPPKGAFDVKRLKESRYFFH